MKLSAIVAMSMNQVIGRNNQLPWRIPEDLIRFRKITTGHPIIMGRKTFESIGRVLPDRENIIISRQPNYKIAGARVVQSLEDALSPYKDQSIEVFIIGGAQIYELAFPDLHRIYLTLVYTEIEGDAYFPEIPSDKFKEVAREDHYDAPVPHSFITFEASS